MSAHHERCKNLSILIACYELSLNINELIEWTTGKQKYVTVRIGFICYRNNADYSITRIAQTRSNAGKEANSLSLISGQLTSSLMSCSMSSSPSSAFCIAIFGHRRRTQACLLRPVPPNFSMSLQCLHSPQSGSWHASHTPQRRRLGAELDFPSIWWRKKCSKMFLTSGVVVACVERADEVFEVT